MATSPRFPLYIPSKGRFQHARRLTIRALDAMSVQYLVVVEPQERDSYAAEIGADKVLVLDMSYKERYDTFDDLGLTKSTGPGPARNFIWDHAIAAGHAWHWVMDDNIRDFMRLNRNVKSKFTDGSCFWLMEEFVLRYTNIGMAGPNYEMFCPRKTGFHPFALNTRIYSCNLIRNDLPFRWRGRYNEDTDLSLRMLKAGWCTVQFNAFLQNKMWTQTVKGGNSAEFYEGDGTLAKSQMQVAMHPDVSKLVWRFGRWHHLVNYRPFRGLRLNPRPDLEVPSGPDEHGLRVRPHE
jgi:hypothetical protein